MRLALLLVAACGRIGFAPAQSSGGDAGTDPGGASDGVITGRHWVNRNLSDPGPLTGARMTYDGKRGRILMYGGSTAVQSAALWELTAAGWRAICASCPPGQRTGAGLAYDPIRDRLVVFGGANLGGLPTDTWELDATSNTWMPTATSGPGQRAQAQLYFDPVRGKILLVGGTDINATAARAVWSYDGTWVDLQIPNAPAAGGFGQSVAFDPDRAHALILSGTGGTGSGDDALYQLDTAWSPVCTGCSGTQRRDASIVHDDALRTEWLIGGTSGTRELAGTWQLVQSAWMMTYADPPARAASAVAYDQARDVIVLYGGTSAACTNSRCSDTWELVPD